MKLYYRQNNNLFSSLLLMTFVFLLAEISFLIQGMHHYLFDFHFISRHISIPYTIVPGVLFFIFAQLLLHLAYCSLVWLITLTLASLFKWSASRSLKLGLLLWLLGLISILVANQVFFPNSRFADLSSILFPAAIVDILFYLLAGFWVLVSLMVIFTLLASLSYRWLCGLALLGFSILGYWTYQNYFYLSTDAASSERPNIILIGVDSLRPDYLDFFGAAPQTKFFKPFLQKASVFSKAFTPIARTYPSWISILSGNFPKISGVRYNLSGEPSGLKTSLISTFLQKQGYRTIFATDETQFSNIDQDYGFDEAITPPIGLNDFLLASFNDFPLSNLVVNSWLGQWLFPHSYGNRPAYVTYNPNSFLAMLRPHLKQSRHQPLFLSAHFCLTHYPYLWASHSSFLDKETLNRYKASILRVDQQVNDFMAMLQQYHLLEHAIVVLLSDHGEAFELYGDRITGPKSYVPLQEGKSKRIPRFYPPSVDSEAVNQSVGHGTDVLGFSQYHSLLAFRLYGLGPQTIKVFSDYVLLLDIKPTLLDFLKLKTKGSGLSLAPLILGHEAMLAQRDAFFLESDYSPTAVRSVHPETRNVVLEGVELFTIDPKTTRVQMKASMGDLIISSKQFATINQNWILALYPRAPQKMIPVLVNLSSGQWTTDLRSAFAQKSPQKRMLASLKEFYGKEIKQLAQS